MKAKIDKNGNLWLERAGYLKETACPFQEKDYHCGDWCPLFNVDIEKNTRPTIKEDKSVDWVNLESIVTIIINLCHKKYVIDEEDFTDERVKENNQ